MNEIKQFQNEEFGEIRTITKDGDPWFVGKDIAEALGYRETASMRKILDELDYMEINPQRLDLSGFVQNATSLEPNKNITRMLLINESGLYQAIFNCTLPNAKKFKRWVTSEVLPSIRKHGGYVAGQEEMTNEELLSKALLYVNSKLEEKNKVIEEMTPKALFADSVATSKTTILVGELAKILKGNGINIGQNRLFEWMRANGYLIRRLGTDYNMPTQRAMELGLFQIKETTITKPDGHLLINKTPKLTGKGQQYFINLFLSR